MIKKIFKENILAVVFLICFAIYGIHVENEGIVKISFQLTGIGLITSIVTTAIFFMIPARFASAAFMFMFMAIGVKFAMVAALFGYGLYHTPNHLTTTYVLSGLFVLFLYKISLFFFMNDEK